MVLQFRSVIKSMVVMLTVPLALIGALLGLWITGSPLGFMAMLAMVSLVGVMVSHIIVLSDYIEQARAQGMPLEQALVKAGLARLRPVLVTVLATVGGLIPLFLYRRRALASVDGGAHRRPAFGHGDDAADVADALLRLLRQTEIHQVRITPCVQFLLIVLVRRLTLTGCAVGPNYRRPTVNTPAAFRGTTEETVVSTNSFADLPWWGVFKDPALQDLVRVALTNSYDLRITLTRIDQARALQAQARSQFMPQINYDGEAARGRDMYLGTPTLFPHPTTTDSYLAGFEAVWEIDLWGRVRRMNEAARANFMASQEGRRAVMTSVVSGVAASYFELLELDDQLAIAQRTRDSYERTLKLFCRPTCRRLGIEA